MIVLGSRDDEGKVWCYIVTGEAGLLKVSSPGLLRIDANAYAEDRFVSSLSCGREVGSLIIDPARRKRIRVNGSVADRSEDGGIGVKVAEAYGNCNRYIHPRRLSVREKMAADRFDAQCGKLLNDRQQRTIAGSDTFFIASVSREGGMDASHRGGPAGFVRVVDDGTLLFPDYSGNMLFNTLGNLVENPSAGLLFVDFKSGDTLHLAGNAEILWDRNEKTDPQFPGAQRLIRVGIEAVVQVQANGRFIWENK